MSTIRKIFDKNALEMKHARAQELGRVDFIDNFAIQNALDILADIKTKFNEMAIVGRRAKYSCAILTSL